MWNRGGRSAALDRAEALLAGKTNVINGLNAPKSQKEAGSIGESGMKRTAPPHTQTPSLSLRDLSWVRSVSERGLSPKCSAVAENKWERQGPPAKEDARPETSLGGGSRFLKKTAPPVSTRSQSPALTKNQTAHISEHRYESSSQRSSQSAALSSLGSMEDNLLKLRGNSTLQSTGKSISKSILKARSTPPVAVHSTVSVNRSASHSPAPSSQCGSPHGFSSSRAWAQLSPSPSVSSASVAPSPSPTPNGSPCPSPSMQGSLSRTRHLPLSLSVISGHSEVQSLEELFLVAPGSDDAQSESSSVSSEGFKMNIMTLDDLGPLTLGFTAKEKKKQPKQKKNKTSQNEGGRGRGQWTADQQLTSDEEEFKKHREEEEVVEEEGLLDYPSDFESGTEERSAISERLGGDGEEEEVSEVREDMMSESDRSSHHRRREDDYSSSFSVTSRRSSVTPASRRSKVSVSRTSQSRASYSKSQSDCRSSSSDTVTSPAVREAAVQTQPDVLAYTWSAGMAAMGPAVGMAYVDPTPVASHTVSAEAVEALSAYSPAVFALNDMLRQQLTMTRHFIHTSSHLHSCLVQSLGPADYSYTTLEDTKEFIRKNKPPTLTVEQALEEVLQEMRDYHYI